MTGLQIARSAFTGSIFLTLMVHWGVHGAVPLGTLIRLHVCQTAPNDRLGLTCTLWLFLCFTEDTLALSLGATEVC